MRQGIDEARSWWGKELMRYKKMIQEIENFKNNIKKGFGYVFQIQDCSMSFQDSSNSKRSFKILRILKAEKASTIENEVSFQSIQIQKGALSNVVCYQSS